MEGEERARENLEQLRAQRRARHGTRSQEVTTGAKGRGFPDGATGASQVVTALNCEQGRQTSSSDCPFVASQGRYILRISKGHFRRIFIVLDTVRCGRMRSWVPGGHPLTGETYVNGKVSQPAVPVGCRYHRKRESAENMEVQGLARSRKTYPREAVRVLPSSAALIHNVVTGPVASPCVLLGGRLCSGL